MLLALPRVACGAAAADSAADSLTFKDIPRLEQPSGRQTLLGAHPVPVLLAGAGVSLASLVVSQVLLHAADDRYDLYRNTSDIGEMQRLYREARKRDRWSNAFLLTGEALGAVTLVLAWHELGAPASLHLAPRAVAGGAGLELRWHGR